MATSESLKVTFSLTRLRLRGSYYFIRAAKLATPTRFPQPMSSRGVVAILSVLKCRPEKVPPLARSVPQRLRVVYGALGAAFCVLSLACALFMQFCMPSFACGALGAEFLRAELLRA